MYSITQYITRKSFVIFFLSLIVGVLGFQSSVVSAGPGDSNHSEVDDAFELFEDANELDDELMEALSKVTISQVFKKKETQDIIVSELGAYGVTVDPEEMTLLQMIQHYLRYDPDKVQDGLAQLDDRNSVIRQSMDQYFQKAEPEQKAKSKSSFRDSLNRFTTYISTWIGGNYIVSQMVPVSAKETVEEAIQSFLEDDDCSIGDKCVQGAILFGNQRGLDEGLARCNKTSSLTTYDCKCPLSVDDIMEKLQNCVGVTGHWFCNTLKDMGYTRSVGNAPYSSRQETYSKSDDSSSSASGFSSGQVIGIVSGAMGFVAVMIMLKNYYWDKPKTRKRNLNLHRQGLTPDGIPYSRSGGPDKV